MFSVQGSADAAASALVTGTLDYDPDTLCNLHGHHHDCDCRHDYCANHHCHGNRTINDALILLGPDDRIQLFGIIKKRSTVMTIR